MHLTACQNVCDPQYSVLSNVMRPNSACHGDLAASTSIYIYNSHEITVFNSTHVSLQVIAYSLTFSSSDFANATALTAYINNQFATSGFFSRNVSLHIHHGERVRGQVDSKRK